MRTIPLPLTIAAKPGVSATSLASGLARRNGAPRLITFCSDIGIDYFRLANGEKYEVEKVAALADADASQLIKDTPRVIRKNWFQLEQEEIKFTAFRRTKPRICPVCAKSADAHDRRKSVFQTGLAQLSSVRVCIKHGCLLVDLPPPPSNKDHFDIAQLGIGYKPTEPHLVSTGDLSLEAYIRQRIRGDQADRWIDQLPFHVATQTAEYFGLLLLKGSDFRWQDATPEDWLKAGHIGYGYLKRGPETMVEKLEELESRRPNDNSRYRSRFGVFFNWLRHRDDDCAFDPIRNLVRDFIFETYPIPKGMLVLGVENPKRRFHSLQTVAKEKRLNPTQTGHALLKRGYTRRNDSGHFELIRHIPESVAAEVAYELRRVYGAKRTAEKLGVTRAALDDLTKHGLIARHFQHQGAVPAYHSDEIWRFATSVTANWQPYIHTVGVEKWVSFQDAAKRAKCATWQVLAVVIKHDLPVTNPKKGKTLLSDHLVCPTIVQAVFTKLEAGRTTLLRAGKNLGCNTETIENLIKIGKLQETPAYARRWAQKFRTVENDSLATLTGIQR